MNRWIALAGLCATLGLAPVLAQQPGKVYRIGFLGSVSPSPEVFQFTTDHLWRGLRERGWIEGKNFTIEQRWAEGRPERLPGLAAELVASKVDIIVVGLNDAALAARTATSTIPIVTVLVTDPVRLRLVKSYARPGGNVTGLSYEAATAFGVKHLDILKQTMPRMSRVAVLWNATSPANEAWVNDTEVVDAARSLNVALRPIPVRSADEFEVAFSRIRDERAEGLLIMPDAMFFNHRPRLTQLAVKHKLPTISALHEFAELGGLLSYVVDIPDSYRRAAPYVDKILRGTKPAELAIEQPTKFVLTVNLKTAKAIGLAIPSAIRTRADRVIE